MKTKKKKKKETHKNRLDSSPQFMRARAARTLLRAVARRCVVATMATQLKFAGERGERGKGGRANKPSTLRRLSRPTHHQPTLHRHRREPVRPHVCGRVPRLRVPPWRFKRRARPRMDGRRPKNHHHGGQRGGGARRAGTGRDGWCECVCVCVYEREGERDHQTGR